MRLHQPLASCLSSAPEMEFRAAARGRRNSRPTLLPPPTSSVQCRQRVCHVTAATVCCTAPLYVLAMRSRAIDLHSAACSAICRRARNTRNVDFRLPSCLTALHRGLGRDRWAAVIDVDAELWIAFSLFGLSINLLLISRQHNHEISELGSLPAGDVRAVFPNCCHS